MIRKNNRTALWEPHNSAAVHSHTQRGYRLKSLAPDIPAPDISSSLVVSHRIRDPPNPNPSVNGEASKGCPDTAATHMTDVLASDNTVQQLRPIVQIPSLNSTEDMKSPTLTENNCQTPLPAQRRIPTIREY